MLQGHSVGEVGAFHVQSNIQGHPAGLSSEVTVGGQRGRPGCVGVQAGPALGEGSRAGVHSWNDLVTTG